MSTDIHNSIERVSENETLTESIVLAVADAVETDPLDLEPLHDSVDPDALDQLFPPASVDVDSVRGRVEFRYADCDVTVHADERVVVTPIDAAAISAESIASTE
jgi:hypothetical protein